MGPGLPFPPSQFCRHVQLVLEVGTFTGRLCADDVAPLPDLQVVTSRPAPAGGVSGRDVSPRPCGERMVR